MNSLYYYEFLRREKQTEKKEKWSEPRTVVCKTKRIENVLCVLWQNEIINTRLSVVLIYFERTQYPKRRINTLFMLLFSRSLFLLEYLSRNASHMQVSWTMYASFFGFDSFSFVYLLNFFHSIVSLSHSISFIPNIAGEIVHCFTHNRFIWKRTIQWMLL